MVPDTAFFRAARSLAVLSILCLAACASPEPPPPAAPVQSPNDTFSYRLVTLDNGLDALLVSNPDSPKAAASLDVHVGSGDNPPDRPGLAHFLEHMLFLGTEKYPDPAEYERYITEHGGSRNAYTSFEHTNYFFDVDAEHLAGALDRFAQFFIAPNFDAAYVGRERNAVEAEFQMGLKSDGRRGLDVLQAAMNPDHPFSRFTVGSLRTLGDRPGNPVREDLLEFYENHYSADLMRLVVVGRESVDELEELVATSFADVPNREVGVAPIDEPLFVEARLPMLLKVEPLGTLRELQVNFTIPDYRGNYDAKPMSYVSNLVGHEGEGSLLSELKRRGLADGLSSGTGLQWRGGALFSITIALTERGVQEYEVVLQQVFAYLDMLRERGPRRRIYQEQASLAELAFRFAEPVRPIGYASSLSNRMHYYADEDILRGPYLMERFDRDMIDGALQFLIADRAQVVLTAPGVTTDAVSDDYRVAYSRLGPEAIMLSRWTGGGSEAFALPDPNPFIAEDVDLLPLAADNPSLPELRVDTPRIKVWHRQADQFRVPKGALYLSFRSPLVGATPQQWAAASVYARMVSDYLNEYTYQALLAGVGFSYYRHAQGLGLRISGYDDKQLRLLEDLLRDMAAQRFDGDRFARIRREMVLELQNTIARRPSSQLLDRVRQAVGSGEYADAELIAALEALDPAALQSWRERFWASARVEAMLYGNHAAADAKRVAGLTDIVLAGESGAPALAPEVIDIAAGQSLQLEADIAHDDAVVAWYLQGDGRDWHDRAAVALTAQAIESGFFQQLRTEQQLGYIVSSFAWPRYDVPGLMLLIQSPSHSAVDVQGAMEEFLSSTPAEIDEEQFERHRAALLNAILKPHENLRERAEFYWQSIASREWGFDGPERLAAAVRAISYDDWLAYYRDVFLENRRSLLALSAGAREVTPELPDTEVFDDAADLREAVPVQRIELAPL
ncbi:MAG: insulinase family protein [Halieaceae bacterium]|jgi:secreted Zn-dependent insulinase-like peptidase|nr:insulinase family protein [Halieaceae bacterium]